MRERSENLYNRGIISLLHTLLGETLQQAQKAMLHAENDDEQLSSDGDSEDSCDSDADDRM